MRFGRGFGAIVPRRLLYRRGRALAAESGRNGACHGHARVLLITGSGRGRGESSIEVSTVGQLTLREHERWGIEVGPPGARNDPRILFGRLGVHLIGGLGRYRESVFQRCYRRRNGILGTLAMLSPAWKGIPPLDSTDFGALE